MFSRGSKVPAVIALIASLLGLLFASNSTLDYAAHLDRRLHDVHCSFIPGAPAVAEAEACRAAMYSPYSALLKDQYWGGIPISLFALGAFCFFAAFSLYVLMAGEGASRRTLGFFALVGITPLLVSLLMLTISLTQLGQVCKTCAGIYISSALLAFGSVSAWLAARSDVTRPGSSLAIVLAWLAALGIATLAPAVVYAASVPDERPYITQCGEIKQAKIKGDSPVKIHGSRAVQPTMLFEDPLCPTCKAFHDRLVAENIIEKLDIELVLFPLDSECNWMLDRPLHPGACIVAKAVLCGEGNARQVLEWAYDQQEYLTRAGKTDENRLRAVIKERWGEGMLRCVDDRKTDVRLNNHLHFASENNIPVSTPQMYLGKRRVCDEDTDLGLRFTLSQLAPEVLKMSQAVDPTPHVTFAGAGAKAAMIGVMAGLVLTAGAALAVRSWTSGAAQRLVEPEKEKPKVAIADQAEVAYCTPQFKQVLERVLHSCGLASEGEGARRGCKPADVKTFASISDDDFNALFTPLKDRGGVVMFDEGRDELDDKAKKLLEERWYARKGARYFFVVARASKTGSVAKNNALSHRRANSVMFFLTQLANDPEIEQKVGLLWLGNEFAQLSKEYCRWPSSRPDEKCDEEPINRSAFVSWVDCRL